MGLTFSYVMKKMNILQLHFIIHVFVIIEFSIRTLQPITGYDSVSRQSHLLYVSASLTSAVSDNASALSTNISCTNVIYELFVDIEQPPCRI